MKRVQARKQLPPPALPAPALPPPALPPPALPPLLPKHTDDPALSSALQRYFGGRRG